MMEVLIEKVRTYSLASRHFTVGEPGPCAVLLASSQTHGRRCRPLRATFGIGIPR